MTLGTARSGAARSACYWEVVLLEVVIRQLDGDFVLRASQDSCSNNVLIGESRIGWCGRRAIRALLRTRYVSRADCHSSSLTEEVVELSCAAAGIPPILALGTTARERPINGCADRLGICR